MTETLFSPASLGALKLSNRIVMAPMTRDRAGDGDIPTPAMVEYYRQRAGAGLIVTEGTQPSPAGKGYWRTPGIYSQAQVAGWRAVTDAVHHRGGAIVLQLMHCGRVVVPDNRGYEAEILAPSELACPVPVPGPDGAPVATAIPRAVTAGDMQRLLNEFAVAATNAMEAGFDGVELHCASGYLINQFLNPASNLRADEFGGPAENRIRFPIAVLKSLSRAVGSDRVGFRISPGNPYNGMDPSNPEATFVPFLRAADALDLAYVHVVDMGLAELDTLAMVRSSFSGPIIANNNLTAHSANELICDSRADAISFGRAFIANPDLVERLRGGAPLAKPNYEFLYTGEDRGYTDYPIMAAAG